MRLEADELAELKLQDLQTAEWPMKNLTDLEDSDEQNAPLQAPWPKAELRFQDLGWKQQGAKPRARSNKESLNLN